MTPTSSLLLICLVTVLLGAGAAYAGTRSARRGVDAHENSLAGVSARLAERGRVLLNRRRIEETHQAIADIPFGVFEQLPPTRDASRVVRKVHDTTAQGVYDSISLINKLTGKGIRRGIHRDGGRDRHVED